MAVMRMGYMHVKVTDLAEAKEHYANTVGLYQTLEQDGRVYYKGWDEWDHHSVVLEEGGVGVRQVRLQGARGPSDVADIETQGDRPSATPSSGWPRARTRRSVTASGSPCPADHQIEFYSHMTAWSASRSARTTPTPSPGTWSASARRASTTPCSWVNDPAGIERFFIDCVGMYPTERVRTSLDDDAHTIATWLTLGESNHDIALLEARRTSSTTSPSRCAAGTTSSSAADIFAMDDVPIDIGPTRHGITRGTTIYFFDPSGNRNETFAGGYRCFRDRPVVDLDPRPARQGDLLPLARAERSLPHRRDLIPVPVP